MKKLLIQTLVLMSLYGMAAAQVDQSQAKNQKHSETLAVHKAAFAQPFDSDKLNAYMKSLPKAGDYFVVEGDLLLTEQELRAYLVANAQGEKSANVSPELLVNTHNGDRDFYSDPAKRTLTYTVDRKTFSADEYTLVLNNMDQAGKAWENACPDCQIHFTHVREFDDKPQPEKVNFTVRKYDSKGEFIAASFFPHDEPSRRNLNIDPSYFTTRFDKVGVLRHEIGHILGYRHEHIRGISGCYFEDSSWQPLTPYDPKSVMHYFCGGAGSLQLELTTLDKTGHRALYLGSASSIPTTTGLVAPDSERRAETLAIHKGAFAQPFDRDKLSAYMNSLPKDGNYFVVEGDLLLTEQELRAYLVATGQGEKPALVSPELLVNTHNGQRDFYSDPSKRRLTYAIDRKTFTADEYALVIKNMELAGRAWEGACPQCQIHFTHLAQLDDNPQPEKINFTVRKHDSNGEYIAASFFPHDDPSRRILNIDPSYFSTEFDKVGVLRHEIGHILGYRHEHIRGVSGCYYEDSSWQPLTPYDPKSVMHYFCGGAGTLQLELTALDKTGHRNLYRIPTQGPKASLPGTGGSRTVVVNFEGGYISQNIIAVLDVLKKYELVEGQTHRVAATNQIESVYFTDPELPYDTKVATDLAHHFNRDQSGKTHPSISQLLVAPTVKLKPYDYSLVFDLASDKDRATLQEIRETWPNSLKYENLRGDSDLLTLRGYQLRVPVKSELQAQEVQHALLLAVSPRTVSVTLAGPPDTGPYYTHDYTMGNHSQVSSNETVQVTNQQDTTENVKDFWTDVRSLNKSHDHIKLGRQGVLGYFVGLPTPPKELMSCDSTTTCPDIILIDTPIDRHPDLGSSVVDGGTDHHLPSPVGKDYQIVEEGDFSQKEDHGTHLAGIIASQDNHFGLIGIHPGAHLHSWNWNTASGDHAQIANKMLPLQDRPSMQIYVFANSWQWANKKGNPEDRFLSDPIGKRIISSKALWITAAGEQAGAPGKPIYLEQDDGPMNLGEHENVIVVTAYEDSGVPHPYLRRDSNYDSNHSKHGLVHIAGPGGNIPSTMSFGKYASESGTSEATAFVAGVASAMASLYPSYYSNSPAKLKFRLQITSSPDLADEDLPKVRAGMLNAQMALLDPTKNWIDASPIRNLVWCKDSISVLDPSDRRPMEGGKGIDVQDIFRLHERDDGKWFVFEEVKESPGEVIRIGPGLIKDDENLFTADGSLKKLMQVRDVLLAGDVHEVTECR
jgi:peptidoglycan/xylan/chitin deacetylase (PgdA/CDA1 family)